jgi:lysophospholipase L1-like esterase
MIAALIALVLAAPAPSGPVPIEGPERLTHFFAALRSLEHEPDAGRVRVLHFGDSHVAADLWTGTVRAGLQQRFGDGGRGYVLAGRPWPTFWQQQIQSGSEGRWRADGLPGGLDDGQVGPGGCSVASADPDSVVTVATKSERGFTTVDVNFLRQPGGGCFDLTVDGSAVGTVPTRGPWTEPGFARFDLSPGPHRVEVRPRAGGETRLLGLSMENASGVVYDALGINGAQAERLLRADPAGFSAVVGHLKPTLIVVSYGTNEAFDHRFDPERYVATMNRVLGRLRAAVPEADCLLTGPGDSLQRGRTPPPLEAIIDLQRRLAKERGCAFWDERAAMGGPGAIRKWRRARMAQPDNVHLTREGYDRVGTMFFEALMRAYETRPADPP